MKSSYVVYLHIALETIFMYQNFRYMRLFHGKDIPKNKKLEYASYIIYYIINVAIFRLIKVPLIVMISNILCLFVISLNYNTDTRKRLLSVFTLFAASISIEAVGLWLYRYTFPSVLNRIEDPDFAIYVVYLILLCIFIEVCYKLKNIKQEHIVPHIFLLTISLNIILIVCILYSAKKNDIFQVILCGLFMLFFNFTINYYYENVSSRSLVLIEENKSFQKQIEIMNMHTENNTIFRHELKNNMIFMKHFIENNKSTEALGYLNTMDKLLNDNKTVKTGVSIVDSILNNKFFEARYRGLEIEYKVAIPANITYDDFDMTILLGNVMDFAIVQTCNARREQVINLDLVFRIDLDGNGWLKIQMRHPIKEGVTFKCEQTLKHVKKTVEKYNGHVIYDLDKDTFVLNSKMLLMKC